MTGVLIRRGEDTQRYTVGGHATVEAETGADAATRQGVPRIASRDQKLRERLSQNHQKKPILPIPLFPSSRLLNSEKINLLS